ncbi:hypothetical protein BT69DRAFT_1276687 [Atractiella rhizophila]|nr:hypothetical protein BT69DRAFT_1276687 [Atractiella rhizophila]
MMLVSLQWALERIYGPASPYFPFYLMGPILLKAKLEPQDLLGFHLHFWLPVCLCYEETCSFMQYLVLPSIVAQLALILMAA